MNALILTNHAKQRMMKRDKATSLMKPKELSLLISTAVEFNKEIKKDHGFKARYYLIESIKLVLVVNPQNNKIVTVYKKDLT
jgi:hypothetical protein